MSRPGRPGDPGAVTRNAGTPVYQGSRPLPADPAPPAALLRRFPPRPVPGSWALTSQPKTLVLERLLAPPFPTGRCNLGQERRRGLTRALDWLEQRPGDTWQDRWITSGADAAGNPAWRGLLAPATPAGLSAEMTRVRDPAGFAALAVICQGDHVNSHTTQLALRRIAAILAARGGLIADITIGDCWSYCKSPGTCCAAATPPARTSTSCCAPRRSSAGPPRPGGR